MQFERFVDRRWFRVCVAMLFVGLSRQVALADFPTARLTSIFPPAGQAGSSFKTVFAGTDLDGATAVWFTSPGISAKPVSSAASEATFELTIAPDVPSGSYDARIQSRHGISNVRAIWVGTEREVAAATDNTAPATAVSLNVDSAIAARCTERANQFYVINLSNSQHVVIECVTDQIDSKMLPVMLVNDAAGREVARSRRGGIVDFIAPAEGRYILCVHDVLFRGGAEFPYHVAVSTRPHLDSIFPPVGHPGTTSKYLVLGRNLPGGAKSSFRGADGSALDQLEVQISLPQPSLDETGSRFEYRVQGDSGYSNPVFIAVEDFQSCAHFPSTGSAEPFEFAASKGQEYWFEILSDRLGAPSAPDLLVQRMIDTGKGDRKTEDIRDANGVDPASPFRVPMNGLPTRDVAFGLTIPQSGTYRVTPRDLFTTADGYPAAYALSAAPAVPDFDLTATPAVVVRNAGADVQPTGGIVLRRGGTFPIDLLIYRRGGFSGDVRVDCEGLPPGITASGLIAAGQNEGVLFLSADKSAKSWTGAARIVGHAASSHGDVTRQAGYRTIVWGAKGDTETTHIRTSRDFSFSVIDEPAPLVIAVAAGKNATLAKGRNLHVPLHFTSAAQITAPMQIKPLGMQQFFPLQETAVTAKGNDAVFDFDLGTPLRPGKYVIYLEVTATVPYPVATAGAKKPGGNISGIVYSQPIILNTAANPG